MSDKPRAQVFIDLENMEYRFQNKYGYSVNWKKVFVQIQEKYDADLIAFAPFMEKGSSLSGKLKRWLQKIGVKIHNLPYTLKVHSNLADMAMINYMWHTAVTTGDQYQIFILMTGDADFVETIRLITKLFPKKIIVYGIEGATSEAIKYVADEVHFLDQLHLDNQKGTLEEFLLLSISNSETRNRNEWFTFESLRYFSLARRKGLDNYNSITATINKLLAEGLVKKIEIEDSFGNKIPRLYIPPSPA